MKYKKVAVLKGGPSSERDVSLRSGAAVAKGLLAAGYEVVEVDVRGRELDLPSDVEAVFIAMHGEFGEDGQVQALLEEKGIPYTGSGVEASRLSFNKILSKERLREVGVPTPDFEVLSRGEQRSLPFPLVVKPACQGSSIGVHRVFDESGWADAVEDVFSYGSEVLVEAYIKGRELTVGVVDGRVLPVVEIVAPDSWYDFKSKYTVGACKYLVPAPIDDGLMEKCQSAALRTFDALGCSGFARVDFLADAEGNVYVLELNNIPGFTETSLLPKAAAEAGMSFQELCAVIMESA